MCQNAALRLKEKAQNMMGASELYNYFSAHHFKSKSFQKFELFEDSVIAKFTMKS